MQCPVDGETLVIAERSGVEIDYCPRCRGVWLDRGELDKIIDRSDAQAGHAAPPRPAPGGYRGGYKQTGYKKKKRGLGLLEEIFDF
ncbi:zf-TFIIB domain-containing protein [Roseobacter sp. S98]|uniref:TFIIB-type zinc ribbon-containing protein n=1 Tax=Roseobacter algicola (ex Choi et al. 2025) (nom. illeg.) TaxID=3092138 RepID=UPI003F50DC95